MEAKGIVLVVHGFTETADKYLEVIYYFMQMGYHVCALDQCGHGRTYRLVEGDLSLVHVDRYERYVKDLQFVALMAKKSWPGLPLYLYAHSMGGGVGCINDTIVHLATSEMGFGGFGESGMGEYHGKTGFDTFTHYKSIVDKKTWVDLPIRYQPYWEDRWSSSVFIPEIICKFVH